MNKIFVIVSDETFNSTEPHGKFDLQFLLIAGLSSALSLSVRLPTKGLDPIGPICEAVRKNPTISARIVENLKKAFADGAANQKFPLSVTYINQQSSQLLAGGSACQSFFNGLVAPFRTDLQNNKLSVQNVQDQLKQFIQNKFPQIFNLFG